MLSESSAYAKEAVVGKWVQWLLLVVATLILAIPLMGYIVRVLRGDKPAPEVTGWGSLFIDGIKYLVISVIYALPALIILFVTMGSVLVVLLAAIATQDTATLLSGLEGFLFGSIIFLVVAIICALFGTIALLRFARTGSMGEAFNFAEIRDFIARIGWWSYIAALLVIMIVQIVIAVILEFITMVPVIGLVIELVLLAPVAIFEARYLALMYENAVRQ